MSKDYCPICRQNTNHKSLFKEHRNSDRDDEFQWSRDFEVIKCLGCDNIQYRTTYQDESMIIHDPYEDSEYAYDEKNYFPKNIKAHILVDKYYYIPIKIRVVYIETIEAMKNNCYLLAAVGLRAIIESICREQKISGKNLEQKINSLSRNKLITETDSNRLHSIRFLGNDSVHEMEVPKEGKLRVALKIVENLINSLYLIDIDINEHLDTMINDYEGFNNLFIRKFVSVTKGDEKSVKEVLGKDYRRLEPSYISNFTQQVIDEVINGTITNVSIGAVKNSSVENIPVQHFIKN